MPCSHVLIEWEDALSRTDLKHAAHCLLYYTEEREGRSEFYALMQVRSDGMIGFPGGHIEADEDISSEGIVSGLNRELLEEINLSPENRVPPHHYVCSHHNVDKGLVCHFYHMPLSKDQFEKTEKQHTTARDFPTESLGIFRIPVFWNQNPNGSKDFKSAGNEKFWSVFEEYPFCGNSCQQLLISMQRLGIIDKSFEMLFLRSEASSDPSAAC